MTRPSPDTRPWPAALGSRYARGELLGRGGQGAAWAADDRLTGDRVVVKLVEVPRGGPGSAERSAALDAEFAHLATLDHPGVVPVRTVGRSDGLAWLVTERIEGPRWDRWWPEASRAEARLDCARAVLETLAWLHDEGIVHGDVKPANVLVTQRGGRPWPVLIDFGLAWSRATDRERAVGGHVRGGTARYLAPEAQSGLAQAPDPRTDLFAFGVCLMEHPEAAWPDEARRGVVALAAACSAPDAEARPADAADALTRWPGGAESRHGCGVRASIGSRDVGAVWSDALRGLRDELVDAAGGDGRARWVRLPPADDADRFGGRLVSSLALAGRATLPVARAGARGVPWDAVADALGAPPRTSSRGTLPPTAEDQKDALEARAQQVLTRLRMARLDTASCTAVLTGVERWAPPDRYVLARALEAGALPSPVIVAAGMDATALPRGGAAWCVARPVPPPSGEALDALLRAHRVSLDGHDAARRRLEARASVGAMAARATLQAWVAEGHLVWTGAAWRLSGAGLPAERAGSEGDSALDSAWLASWQRLSDEGRAWVLRLWRLGGVATWDELESLTAARGRARALDEEARGGAAGEHLTPALVARLVDGGFVRSLSGARLGLEPPAERRLDQGRLQGPPVPREELEAAVARLRAPAAGRDEVARLSALARACDALGDAPRAHDAWRALSDEQARALDPAAAGHAALQAAARATRPGMADAAAAFEAAELAARFTEAAGDAAALGEALAVAAEAARALNTPRVTFRQAVVEARAAVHRAATADALVAVARARAGLDAAYPPGGAATNTRRRAELELALASGTALGQSGDRDGAAERLAEAADLAAELGDTLGEGRVANTLGITHFHRGDFGSAAAAWSRAAEAKERANDSRGWRIAKSNRGLALRELGQLVAAAETTRRGLEAAKQTGDRRGQATGHLALAQLWLDVGAVDAAAESLAECRAIPVASQLVAADTAVLDARRLVATGEVEAAARALSVQLRAARDEGLGPVEREAWGRLYLAAYGPVPAGAEHGAALGGAPVPAPPATLAATAAELARDAGGHGPLLRACEAHALALAGQSADARARLEPAVAALARATAPGALAGLPLLLDAAELAGDRGGLRRLTQVAAEVVEARRQAGATLLGEAAPPVEAVAHALGLMKGFAGDEGRSLEPPGGGEEPAPAPLLARRVHTNQADVPAFPDTQANVAPPRLTTADTGPLLDADPTPALDPDAVTHALLHALPAARRTTPEPWAAALCAATGARSCALFDGDGRALSAWPPGTGGGPGERWVALAGRLRATAQPFVGRAADGRIEAAGFPLPAGGVGDQPGACVLGWTDLEGRSVRGAPRDGASLGRALAPALDLAGLCVGRAARGDALTRARARETELVADLARLRTRHTEEVTQLRDALAESRVEHALRHDYDQIVHRSAPMRRVLATLDKVTERNVPVLVVGESGVGKELLARAVHANSPRRAGPFIAENCGAVPAELFEAVFFGHVRGAFTGAHAAKKGLIEAAQGGTLFLDEVGELRPEHQVKLLRVFQERRFRPVGGTRELAADFRLVAATNRDLMAMVREGTFREDLYYRLAVVTVDVPPLRARPEDIVPIAAHLLDGHASRMDRTLRLSPQAADRLQAHRWPGNVRELDNELLRAAVLCEGETIRPAHLSERVLRPGPRPPSAPGPDSPPPLAVAPPAATPRPPLRWRPDEPLSDAIARLEADAIAHALARTGGTKSATARLLGISRPGLDAKLARHGLDPRAFRPDPDALALARGHAPPPRTSSPPQPTTQPERGPTRPREWSP